LWEIDKSNLNKAKSLLGSITKPSAEALFYRGFTHLQLNEFEDALTNFESAIKQEPTMIFAYLFGSFAARELGDPARAIQLHREANQFHSEYIPPGRVSQDVRVLQNYFERFGKRYIENVKTMAKKIKKYSGELEKIAQMTEYTNEALTLISEEDYQQTLVILDKMLALEPFDEFALSEKAYLLAKLGRTEEAKQAADNASEIIGYHDKLAKTYAILGDEKRALEQIEAIIQDDLSYRLIASVESDYKSLKENKDFRKLTTDEVKWLISEEKDYIKALDLLDNRLEQDPNNHRSLANRAYVLAKLGRTEEAKQAADKASEIIGYHDKLAKAYAILGDEKRALEQIEAIIQDDPINRMLASFDPDYESLQTNEDFQKITTDEHNSDTQEGMD
jgi:tetratricopeptide (TPR) repeat protein